MGAPARILHVVRPAEGGIQTHVVQLATRLVEPRFTVMVAGALNRGFQSALGRQAVPWANVAIPGEPDLRALLRAAQQLRRLASSWRPEIVHAHGYLAGLTAAWALRRLRPRPALVLTAHVFPKPPTGEERARLFERWAYRWLFGRLDRGIAVSNAIKAAVEAYTSDRDDLWTMIYNGIDLAHFGRQVPAGIKRKEIGLNPSAAVVGVVARLSPEKGVDVFLRAAAQLAEELPNVDFVVVGDGPERENLEALAHELRLTGQVLFLGQRRDVSEILASLDVLVVPSREESFGLVALEGVAAGVPTVASEVAGLREILDGMDLVRFFPSGDAEALCEAVKQRLTTISFDSTALDNAPIAIATGTMMQMAEMLVSETEFNLDMPGLDRTAQMSAIPDATERERQLERFDVRHMVDATAQLYEDLIGRDEP